MNLYIVNHRTLQGKIFRAIVAATSESEVPQLLDNHHYAGCHERFDHIEAEHCHEITRIGRDDAPDSKPRVIECSAA